MKKIKSREDKIFDFINALIMIFICIFIAYPLYYVFMASFTDPAIVNSGKLLLYPEKLFFAGYQKIISYKPLWTGFYKYHSVYGNRYCSGNCSNGTMCLFLIEKGSGRQKSAELSVYVYYVF